MLEKLIRFSLTQRLLLLVLTAMLTGAGVQAFLGLPARPQDADPAMVNQAGGEDQAPGPEATLARLREAYAEPNRELERLLRRPLPW